MSLFTRRADSHVSPDEAMRRYIELVQRDSEPDPLFRRRLRGRVVNRFVAEREGSDVERRPRSSRMGRLGRACLYASVATAISVGGVMAASESALPGGFFYPIKLSIEDMRLRIAPAHLRDDLLAASLAERIDEMRRLVAAGDTVRAFQLGATISATYEQILSTGDRSVIEDERLAPYVKRLDAVLDQLPVRARRAVERAMPGTLGFEKGGGPNSGPTSAGGMQVTSGRADGSPDIGAGGAPNAIDADILHRDDAKPEHERPPKHGASPERTPKPTPDDS
jgi:hypothetical protein